MFFATSSKWRNPKKSQYEVGGQMPTQEKKKDRILRNKEILVKFLNFIEL